MTPWYTLPDALYQLDDCARRSPMVSRHFTRYARTTDEWCEYDPGDGRVIRLTQVRNRHLEPILNDRKLTGSEMNRLADDAGLSVNPTKAIDAVTGQTVGASNCYYLADVERIAAEIAAAPRQVAA